MKTVLKNGTTLKRAFLSELLYLDKVVRSLLGTECWDPILIYSAIEVVLYWVVDKFVWRKQRTS